GGQVEDLAWEKRGGALPDLERLHARKTGALFRACLHLGLWSAQGERPGGVDARLAEALDGFGRGFGLAFQITDDLLDVQRSAERLRTLGESLMSNPILPTIHSPADLQPLSDAQLEQLAQEMRDELVRVLSLRPAHFASNLGVVELCLALHLTFDFTKDRLIWDTGHQIYSHKLITGRFDRFESIRTRGGLMGYPNPNESEYDL